MTSVTTHGFERARSAEAKQVRIRTILDAATRLASKNGVRQITVTDIAAAVGMHKSALLRYFETREEIFLRLSAAGWVEWSGAAVAGLDAVDATSPIGQRVRVGAAHLAETLIARPLFCDLLAHTPLNLERGVSFLAVRTFKMSTLTASGGVADALERVLPLTHSQAVNVVATATSMAGALWQMAAPGTELRAFYETEPELAHAVFEVGPRLTDILEGLLTGYSST